MKTYGITFWSKYLQSLFNQIWDSIIVFSFYKFKTYFLESFICVEIYFKTIAFTYFFDIQNFWKWQNYITLTSFTNSVSFCKIISSELEIGRKKKITLWMFCILTFEKNTFSFQKFRQILHFFFLNFNCRHEVTK